MKPNKRAFGTEGEKIALQHLIEMGYQILDTNYRAGKFGEIDIAARRDGLVCFIEVKTRTSDAFGTPSEAVGWQKQMTLRRLAQIYLASKNLHDSGIRFDIVEIRGKKSNNIFTVENINIIENAF